MKRFLVASGIENRIFRHLPKDDQGRRPGCGGSEKFQTIRPKAAPR